MALKNEDSRVPSRREVLKTAVACLALPGMLARTSAAAGLRISNRLSPLNGKRPRRPHTRYIILHTTEGEEKGSLNKLVRYGEAHYFVCHSGQVYRIIDKSKIARHTGRSMWEGRTTIDNYSIGIEVCGYHNRDITPAQADAVRELLRQLKSLYDIPDERVLTHSMVAYGRPNRFHNDNHRGRKRCGMIFARPEIRARLGLEGAPPEDPDVKAGRLKVADPELFAFLFARRTEPVLVASGASAPLPVPETVDAPSESPLISLSRTAWQIARERYNHPDTVYVFPDGRRLQGDKVEDWGRIPTGTRVLLSEAEDTQPFEGFLEIGKDGSTPRRNRRPGRLERHHHLLFPRRPHPHRLGAEEEALVAETARDPPRKERGCWWAMSTAGTSNPAAPPPPSRGSNGITLRPITGIPTAAS